MFHPHYYGVLSENSEIEECDINIFLYALKAASKHNSRVYAHKYLHEITVCTKW